MRPSYSARVNNRFSPTLGSDSDKFEGSRNTESSSFWQSQLSSNVSGHEFHGHADPELRWSTEVMADRIAYLW